jgi:PST family polysaccharide transporter
MRLLSTSLVNGVAVAVKIGTTILLSKVLAVYLGPTGFAMIGQFQNLVTVTNTFAGGGIAVGVTKYTAQHAADEYRLSGLWATSFLVTVAWASVTIIAVLVGRDALSTWALADARLGHVIYWLAGSLFFSTLNGLMLAILNGRKLVVPYVLANVAGNVLNAALAIGLVTLHGLDGALISLALGQGVSCIVTFFVFNRQISFRRICRLRLAESSVARDLTRYSLMFATSAIAVPLSQLVIRNHIGEHLGWHEAGLWQAMIRISDTHLMLLTTTLSVYFLPRFSELHEATKLKAEVRRGYLFILPAALATSCVLYLTREALVSAFLSAEFAPVADHLLIQLVGDFLKIGSWLYAITMLSHARTRQFVFMEILFSVVFVLTAIPLGDAFGLQGVAAAYAITYGIYWIATGILFHQLAHSLETGTRIAA